MSGRATPPLAGVVGWPIGHSKSPAIFAHWFERLGVAGRYVPLPVRAEDFPEVVRALPKAGFVGINCTIPLKEAALGLADEATDAARAIGAANMIRFAGGQIVADNTDAFGFLENLAAGAPCWHAASGPALVLGAGGAARAVLHALIGAGVTELRVANRTPERAEALAEVFGPAVAVVPWEARAEAAAGAASIVNATALGMTGQPPLEMGLDAAPATALVTDLVYAPLETPLLADARRRGMVAIDGLGMLLHQARPAFAAWFGVDPPVDGALRRACTA